jgi:hypothetical protein
MENEKRGKFISSQLWLEREGNALPTELAKGEREKRLATQFKVESKHEHAPINKMIRL